MKFLLFFVAGLAKAINLVARHGAEIDFQYNTHYIERMQTVPVSEPILSVPLNKRKWRRGAGGN